MSDLGAWPVITEDLPGTGGGIKAKPSHFVVEEIPLYEPSGEGEHVYVRITREGWTTRDLQKALARLFGLRPADVGAAGLKDKHARVTQTFSLHLPDRSLAPDIVARKVEEALPVRVEWAKRHTNKLRTGHLRGNRFRVVIAHSEPESVLGRAQEIAEVLRKRGVPNYYGEQRFGLEAQNVECGRDLLWGQEPSKTRLGRWMRKLLLSAYQAYLFNEWLAARIRRGLFAELLQGDIAQVLATGGLFEVRDLEAERPKFEQGEITYTGPIYGAKMRWAEGVPGGLEREIFAREGLSIELFHKAKLQGSRRPGRLPLRELKLELHPEGLLLEFTLPKGAYATALLREFLHGEL
jgi:tRNA pseudouridine13 synthase